MAVRSVIKRSEYHDSVSLMLVARTLSGMPGVKDAAVVMATEANKSILASAGLLSDEAQEATANDLAIVVSSQNAAIAESALQEAEQLLKKKAAASETAEFRPRTIRGALSSHPEANVAVISVAGQYAAEEAWDALRRGLHVLLFSDHVSLEDEIALKRYAREHELLLMGPGAGTTMLNNVALGFANVVPAGPIGIVSAAGTGLQEVSSLLARYGAGITQGIGVGGRDLSQEVGGIMMLAALEALQQDPSTRVIALVSKPPADEVAQAILRQVFVCDKPTVVCFLGGDMEAVRAVPHAIPARTLQECALLARQAAGFGPADISQLLDAEDLQLGEQAEQLREQLGRSQKYLRGLFSGGTLCYEAQVIWRDMLGVPIHSNAPLHEAPALQDPLQSCAHTAVDMGEEIFTSGRPHPMIDNSLRLRRLQEEARDPQVAVIMLDVVLGYGAHPDPVAEIGPAVQAAREAAAATGRSVPIVASVTGTPQDPQGFEHTVTGLERAGVLVCECNAAAARLAGMLVQK